MIFKHTGNSLCWIGLKWDILIFMYLLQERNLTEFYLTLAFSHLYSELSYRDEILKQFHSKFIEIFTSFFI